MRYWLKKTAIEHNAPVLPHTQRVIPCSSSSSSAGGKSSVEPDGPSKEGLEGAVSLSFSLAFRFVRPFVVLWVELVEPLEATWIGLRSSTASSISSCLRRFPRLLLLFETSDGRCEVSLDRGAVSESGDLEVLVDAEGTERLPDRLVSLGERGGPMGLA